MFWQEQEIIGDTKMTENAPWIESYSYKQVTLAVLSSENKIPSKFALVASISLGSLDI